MPNIEFRWIIPEGTSTYPMILQYRSRPEPGDAFIIPWENIPVIAVDRKEFQSAQRS